MTRVADEASLNVCCVSQRLLCEVPNCLVFDPDYSAVVDWLNAINFAFGVKLGVRESLFPSCARACVHTRAGAHVLSRHTVNLLTPIETAPAKVKSGV